VKGPAAGEVQGSAGSAAAPGSVSSGRLLGGSASQGRGGGALWKGTGGGGAAASGAPAGGELAGRVFKSFAPFQKVLLTWHSVSYEVFADGFGGGRELIRGASGWVLPGELLAITGAPATGKTSLLNVLSGGTLPHTLPLHLSVSSLACFCRPPASATVRLHLCVSGGLTLRYLRP